MNTVLRFVLAVVLVVGVLVVTNLLFPPAKRPAPPANAGDSSASAAPTPRPSAAAVAPARVSDSAAATTEPERTIVVEGPPFRHVFSTRDARLISTELL